MGRTKVQLKLVEDPVERNTAYHRMKECLNLKAGELSVPCGARVLTMCVNPRTGDVESWPDSGQEVSDILETYRNPGTRHKEVLDLPNYLKGQIRKVHAELKKTCNVLLPRVDDMMKSVAERIWLLESGNREIAVEESLRQENIAYWQGVLQDCSSGFNVFDEPAKFDQFEYQDADVFNYGLDTFVFNPALESTTGVPGDDDWMVNGNKGASCTMNHGVDEPAKFDQPEYDHGDVFSNGRDTFVFKPSENSTTVFNGDFRMGNDDEGAACARSHGTGDSAVVPPASDVFEWNEWDRDFSREPLRSFDKELWIAEGFTIRRVSYSTID